MEGSPLRARVVGAHGRGIFALVTPMLSCGPLAWRPGRESLLLPDLPTDRDGRLTVPALPPGRVALHVRIPGRIQRTFSARVPRDEELVLALYDQEGAFVGGTVRDDTGAAIAQAQVEVGVTTEGARGLPAQTHFATTDGDGTWRVEDIALPGLLESVRATSSRRWTHREGRAR